MYGALGRSAPSLERDRFGHIDFTRSISRDRFHEIDFARSISRTRCGESDVVNSSSVCARIFHEIEYARSISICQNRCRHRAISIRCARIVVDIAFFPGHFRVLFLSHLAFHTTSPVTANSKGQERTHAYAQVCDVPVASTPTLIDIVSYLWSSKTGRAQANARDRRTRPIRYGTATRSTGSDRGTTSTLT